MSHILDFVVSRDLTVICFRKDSYRGPFFAVREFDTKVIRSPSKFKKGRGPSEQAIRASIRQAILNLNLKSERATKAEIRLLKTQGILGKRAPSCSLLNAEDMVRLLESFGKHRCAQDLRAAVKEWRALNPRAPPVPPAGAISGGNGAAAAWTAGFEAGGAAAMAVVNGALSLATNPSTSNNTLLNGHHHHSSHHSAHGNISSSSSVSSNHSSRSNSISHDWVGEETQLIVDEFGDEHPLPMNGSVIAAAALARASSNDAKMDMRDVNGVDAAPLMESPLTSLSSLSSSISPLSVGYDMSGMKRSRKMSRRMEESEAQAGGGIRAVMSMKHEITESDSVPWNPPSSAVTSAKRKQRPTSNSTGGRTDQPAVKRERIVPPPPSGPPPPSPLSASSLAAANSTLGHFAPGNGNQHHSRYSQYMGNNNHGHNGNGTSMLMNGNRGSRNNNSTSASKQLPRVPLATTMPSLSTSTSLSMPLQTKLEGLAGGGLDALLTALGPELPIPSSLSHPHILVPRPLLPGQLSSPRTSLAALDASISSLASTLPGQLMMAIAPSQSPPPIPSSLLPATNSKLDFRPSPPPVVSHMPSPRHMLLPSSMLPTLSPPPVQWSSSPASPSSSPHSPAPPNSPRGGLQLPLSLSMMSPINGPLSTGTGHAFYRPLTSSSIHNSNGTSMGMYSPSSPTSLIVSSAASSSTSMTPTSSTLQLPSSFAAMDLKRNHSNNSNSSSGSGQLTSLTTESGLTIGLEVLSPRGNTGGTGLNINSNTTATTTATSNTTSTHHHGHSSGNSSHTNPNSSSNISSDIHSPLWATNGTSYSSSVYTLASSPPPLSPTSTTNIFAASPGPSAQTRGISGDSQTTNTSNNGTSGASTTISVTSSSSTSLSSFGHLGSLTSPAYSLPSSLHSNSNSSSFSLLAPSPRSDSIANLLMTPLSSSAVSSTFSSSLLSPGPSLMNSFLTPMATSTSASSFTLSGQLNSTSGSMDTLRSFAADPPHVSTPMSSSAIALSH